MSATMTGPMIFQRPTDRLILEELQDAQNLGANVAEAIDRHRKTVTTRLRQLEDYGLVNNVGRGVYAITEKGEVVLENFDDYEPNNTDAFTEIVEEELSDRRKE
ncbi:hypothetical protein [Haladaptatus pallidirubidus]|nr:hypothetical protein [Haladaptatus pallidirubidus]